MGIFSNLFASVPAQTNVMYKPVSEHEAWYAILHSISAADGSSSEVENDYIIRQLVFKKFFNQIEYGPIFKRVYEYHPKIGSEAMIVAACQVISEEYKPTLFTMAIEIIFSDGVVTEREEKISEFLAEQLSIGEVVAEKIITTYKIRYYGNVRVIE